MTDLYLIFLVLVWGINYSVVKFALRDFSPLAFNAPRFLIASLILFAILASRGKRLPRFGKDWWLVIFVGILGNAIYQIVFIYGINWTRAGNTSLILASTPIFVTLFSVMMGHDKVSSKMWIGILASFAGVALVTFGSSESIGIGGTTLKGDLTILLGAVLWSTYLVASAPLVKRYGAIATSAATLWVGTPVMVLCSVPAMLTQNWRIVGPADWSALLFSATFSIAIAQVIWYRAVRERGNSRTSVYSNLTPLAGLLFAWPMLGETPRPVQIAGATAILAGAYLAGIRQVSPAAE
jgi:drug/metabolite transporter (DMT)-like permease